MLAFTRRQFLTRSVLAGGATLAPNLLAPLARARDSAALTGTEFDLTVSRLKASVGGRAAPATLVNGTLPGPLLRWREGDDITLRVTNRLDEDTSIHWHGILLPAAMDGVPGVSFSGIRPGETFVYRFPVKQAGTYWYHSHSGMQEAMGHYGPIVIDPAHRHPSESLLVGQMVDAHARQGRHPIAADDAGGAKPDQPVHQIAVTVAPPQQHDVDDLVGVLIEELSPAGILHVGPDVVVGVLIPAQFLDDLVFVDAQPLGVVRPAVTRRDHRRDLLHLWAGCLGLSSHDILGVSRAVGFSVRRVAQFQCGGAGAVERIDRIVELTG